MHRPSALALTLVATLAASAPLAQSSWLGAPDDAPESGPYSGPAWNRAGAAVPEPPASKEARDALARRCAPFVARGAAVDAVLEKAGWMPFLHLDRRFTRDDIEVAAGTAAAGQTCEPTAFNLFVFVGGRFAGTLSPVPMSPARDGAAGAIRLTGAGTITAEFARYRPTDAACCPSSVVRVTYRLNRAGATPVLEATDLRRVR